MRISLPPRTWPVALLAGALGCGVAGGAAAQQHTMRLVSESPAAAPAPAPVLAPVSGEEAQAIAVDAYIYAYPMVLMEVARRIATSPGAGDGAAALNRFGHKTRFPDADTPGAAWPNRDVLYSNLWYDVTAEPLVVHIPDAGGRYYFMPIMDMWTDVYASRGTRTSGGGEQTFVIVGPYWQGQLPAGVDVVRSPTGMGWLLGRIQADDPQQLAQVGQFQSGLSAMPLSQWARATYGANAPSYAAPGAAAAMAGSAPGTAGAPAYGQGMATPAAAYGQQAAPMQPAAAQPQPAAPAGSAGSATEQVAAMDAATFFRTFAEASRANPPHANDYPMLDRLRRLGLDFSQPFDFARLQPAVQQALTQAGPVAGARIEQALQRAGQSANGWRTVLDGIGTYGTGYLRRAAIAYAGLGANPPEDVIYPLAHFDDEGERLDGDEDYVIHFPADQLPPANAFWSITLYGEDHGFARTPHGRYSLTSNGPLEYNADGSLDIYVQSDEPRAARRANWLPSPEDGPFSLSMRVYWPKASALDGSWAPPPVRED